MRPWKIFVKCFEILSHASISVFLFYSNFGTWDTYTNVQIGVPLFGLGHWFRNVTLECVSEEIWNIFACVRPVTICIGAKPRKMRPRRNMRHRLDSNGLRFSNKDKIWPKTMYIFYILSVQQKWWKFILATGHPMLGLELKLDMPACLVINLLFVWFCKIQPKLDKYWDGNAV